MKANEFMSKIDKGEIEFKSVFASGTFGWEFDFAEAYAREKTKELEKALKAIEKVTDDEDLPLLKVIHQIAFKTLRL